MALLGFDAAALGCFLLFAAQCLGQDGSFVFPGTFTRFAWPASTIADDKLFIDGGELWYSIYQDGGSLHTIYNLGSTIWIDLTKSWTNSTVELNYIEKPKVFPFSRAETIWYNPTDRKIQSYSGWLYTSDYPEYWVGDGIVRQVEITPPNEVWALNIDEDTSAMTWAIDTSQPGPDIGPLRGPDAVASSKALYSLGGWYDMPQDNRGALDLARPGITTYDFSAGTWVNSSSQGYGYNGNGYGAWGSAVYTDLFGDEGVIIYIGGYTPSQQLFTWDSPNGDGLQDMGQLFVYDVASDQFFPQAATGDIPQARWGFCTAGVSEESTGTLDIFLFGGLSGPAFGDEPSDSLGTVYVLSIPSFTWTAIPHSLTDPRSIPACEVAGQRQLIIVGGDDPTAHKGWSTDPWENCIGVYDMSAWLWATRYDAQAPPYQRHADLIPTSRDEAFAQSWDSKRSEAIFTGNPDTLSSIRYSSAAGAAAASNGSSDAGTSPGTIAGAVVGSIVGALLIAGLIFLFMFRRRRQRAQKQDVGEEMVQISTRSSNSDPTAELSATSSDKAELGPAQAWEIDHNNERYEMMTENEIREAAGQDAEIYEAPPNGTTPAQSLRGLALSIFSHKRNASADRGKKSPVMQPSVKSSPGLSPQRSPSPNAAQAEASRRTSEPEPTSPQDPLSPPTPTLPTLG